MQDLYHQPYGLYMKGLLGFRAICLFYSSETGSVRDRYGLIQFRVGFRVQVGCSREGLFGSCVCFPGSEFSLNPKP